MDKVITTVVFVFLAFGTLYLIRDFKRTDFETSDYFCTYQQLELVEHRMGLCDRSNVEEYESGIIYADRGHYFSKPPKYYIEDNDCFVEAIKAICSLNPRREEDE